MELYIVRHGKTIWNAAGRLQGHADITLNEEGRLCAIALGKELASTHIDRIYTSPLSRAKETALLIRSNRDIPILSDDRLKELSFGDMEGISCDEWFDENSPYRFFFTQPDKYPIPPNGESFEEVCLRTKDFLQNVIEPLEDTCERVMIVAHGALNKALMCYIQQNDIPNFWGKGLQKNCACSIFKFENKKWETLQE